MREGQAKVLSERELSRVVNVVKKKAHAERNVALLYCSFGLGLRAKEVAALRIKHVLGVDGHLLEEVNLTHYWPDAPRRPSSMRNPLLVSPSRTAGPTSQRSP